MLVVRKHFRPALNPFTMSFLDTVSAGFGAAFFLFIIFASMPIEKSSSMLGSEEYIQIELEWNSSDYNLELIVDPPNNSSGPLRLFLHNNKIIESHITGEVADLPGRKKWQKAFISGTSTYGQSTSEVIRTEDVNSGNKHRLSFRANGTCYGQWKFLVAVKSKRNYLLNQDSEFRISGKAFTSAIDSVENKYTAVVDLGLGTYLPDKEKYGNSRGALLKWSGGPKGVTDAEYIELVENTLEPMEHCK